MTKEQWLKENEREELAMAVEALYSPSNFPGSIKYNKWIEAQKKLDEYDKNHPEIAEAKKAEREEKKQKLQEEKTNINIWNI